MVTDSATVTMESLWAYETTIALSNGAIADPLPSSQMGVPYTPNMRELSYLRNG